VADQIDVRPTPFARGRSRPGKSQQHIIREREIMVALMSPANAASTMSIAATGAERRMFPRKECNVRVQGKRLDHSIEARQQPQLSFMLKDLSLGGLAGMSATPVGRGERITVFFPPEGPARGWDAYGRVIRCEPSQAGGYRVAVAFDPLPAA
jgi:hypothetical protein